MLKYDTPKDGIMRKKVILIIVLVVIIQVLFVSCTTSKKESEEDVDGKTYDYSSKPKKINSSEIKSFSIEFTHSYMYEDEKQYTCPQGRYLFSMTKEHDNAICNLVYYDRIYHYSEATSEVHFETDLSSFNDLQNLIEEHNLESINGYHKENSALGDYLNLTIEYESGETLEASAEGGGVMPDKNLNVFILFFSNMAREHNHIFIESPENIE